jgi:signal transduction histidine kinase
MNPLTAVLFILLGTALWFVNGPGSPVRTQVVPTVLAVGSMTLGCVRLGAYLGEWSWGVDQVLFPHAVAAEQNVMAPNTALGFVVLGGSLVVLARRHPVSAWWYVTPALVSLLLALFALIGYSYQHTWLYRVGSYIPMAVNTALLFLVLSAGILCVRPAGPVMTILVSPTTGGMMCRYLLPLAVCIPWLAGWVTLHAYRQGAVDQAMSLSLLVLGVIASLIIVIAWTAMLLHRTDRTRLAAEAALQRAHDELEDRVLARTAELSKKTRDLETLLCVTSHDLREPLRAIENFSHMVYDRYASQLDDKGKDFLRRVVRGAQRMDRLMADILALSRAQRMDQPSEEVEGERIVEEALRRLGDKIKETGATVRIMTPLPRFQANRTWATQGVYNLVANALKFTRPNTPPEIEIAPYHSNGSSPPEVGLVVRDRGPGVDPGHAERIFQLFQRAVGREVEGTGAGLAIVRQVAERHGGRAWVQARAGGGSEFLLTFGPTGQKGGSHDDDGSGTRDSVGRR